MDDATYELDELAYGHIKELYELCSSDNLSLSALQQKINTLDERDIQNISRVQYIELPKAYEEGNVIEQFPFLHMACRNKNVTLEIINYLLDTFPNTTGKWSSDKFCSCETEAYPLHLACCNEDCPTTVIEYLVIEFPSTIQHSCVVGKGIHPEHPEFYIEGLPLHYYLSRDKNVDFDTVKMMVEAYPQSLITSDEEWLCYPIHLALSNGNINLEIIEYFLELEPETLNLVNGDNATFLHLACYNEHLTLERYQFILNKWSEAIQMRDNFGSLPMHALSMTKTLDEDASIDILRSMLDIDLNLVRERDIDGYIPIHHAVRGNSIEFCKVLIEVYPESMRVGTSDGSLPIHEACSNGGRDGQVETIQYLLEIYPESINVRDGSGWLPIHCAAMHGNTKVIELLLKHDPDAATKKTTDPPRLPLHVACERGSTLSVKILYDAYPEAILINNSVGRSPIDLARGRARNLPMVRFLRIQLEYAQKVQDMTVMTTPDENGWLPLHHALKDKVPLGTIKLFLKGNPSAIRVPDNQFAFPLHIACEFSSAKVVRYLAGESNKYILGHLDENKDSILHYACRGRNLDIVKYLLDEHTSLVSSVEVNGTGELPIHLLCKPGKDKFDDFTIIDDYDGTECTEAIWRMLLAKPEAVVTI